MKTLNKLTLSLLAGAATFSMMTIPVFASNLEVSTDPVGDTIIYDDEGNIPVYADGMVGPEAAYASLQTFTLNGETYEVVTYSETYKEVFDKVKELVGDQDFVIRNKWGTQVYSWYKIKEDGNVIVDVCNISTPAYASLQTFTLNGEAYEVFTYSETYKEVFDKVKEVLGHSDFVVKNAWGSQVYSWYTVNDDGKVSIELLDIEVSDPEETVVIYERTFTLNGKEYTVECLSGTYKEVFEAIKDVVGDEAVVVKNQWGSVVYSWYKVTDSGKCTVSIVGVEAD